MGMIKGKNVTMMMVDEYGKEHEIKGVQDVQIESDHNIGLGEIKRINYQGTFSGTLEVDQDRIEQLIAKMTPYSNMIKSIKMPDGKYLVRGKQKTWK